METELKLTMNVSSGIKKPKLKSKLSADIKKHSRQPILARNNESQFNISWTLNNQNNDRKFDDLGRRIYFYKKPWESATPDIHHNWSPERSPDSQ